MVKKAAKAAATTKAMKAMKAKKRAESEMESEKAGANEKWPRGVHGVY